MRTVIEKEWNMDTLREVAMKLTVDANGNDATSEEFDPEQIVQFGFMNQWTDPRGIGTFFGSGSLVADDGVTAQIPANWKTAWEWTYKGWWEDYFIPNGPYGGADFLQGPGGPFSSGNLGMIHMHMWYVAPWALGDVDWNWNLAATPSYNGVVTSKMHADTFGILKGSKNPDAAFEVLTYMLSAEVAPNCSTSTAACPPACPCRVTTFATYGETNFPGKDINWDVVVDSMAYADNPNHESYMPSFQETTDRYNEYWNLLANTPGADFEAETAKLLLTCKRSLTQPSSNNISKIASLAIGQAGNLMEEVDDVAVFEKSKRKSQSANDEQAKNRSPLGFVFPDPMDDWLPAFYLAADDRLICFFTL
jgi:multiple sugar transport system substrate-binding protein